MEANRMSTKEAAELLGTSEQFVRIGLQRGVLKFGYAVNISGGKRWTYVIPRAKFYEETGIRVEGRNI